MRTLRRIRRMDVTEIACRGRQEAAKWFDRARLAFVPDAMAGVDGNAPLPRAYAAGPDTSGTRLETPGLPGPGGSAGRPLCRTLETAERDVMDAAGRIRGRRFDLLGYRGLSFGDPIDWQLDPVAGRCAPRVHWSRIAYLDPEVVGDHKVVWELNRHQWMVTLAQAWRLSADRRYAREAADRMADWIEANPYGRGVNWASSLEVSLRLIAWCWTLSLLRDADVFTPDAYRRVVASARAHARHVERYLSYYFSPNTHLTGEALGLVYAGLWFPEFRESSRWIDLGRTILLDESERQIAADGVHLERATCYQRYTAEIYLHFLMLAARAGFGVPPDVRARLGSVVDVLVALAGRDGEVPEIGDADGGWLLPLAARRPGDCRGVFGLAAALLGRADHAWAAGGVVPEVVWMLGAEGCEDVERLVPRPPEGDVASRAFADGGCVVMRSGWQDEAHLLVLDAGPIGYERAPGHGHADLLSLHCRAFGEDLLVDPGTYCYTADAGWRNYFRGTAAHSTIRVDDRDQAEPAGPFAWRSRPAARLRAWRSTADHDYAEAEHDAYADLPGAVRHRRRVVFVKPRFWIVLDDLLGEGQHALDVRFQCAARPVAHAPAPWVAVRGARDRGLWIGLHSPVHARLEVLTGQGEPKAGWISSAYGQRQPAPAVSYRLDATLPIRLVTLLVPVERLTDVPPRAGTWRGTDGQIGGLCVGDRDVFEFDATHLVRTGGGAPERLDAVPSPNPMEVSRCADSPGS